MTHANASLWSEGRHRRFAVLIVAVASRIERRILALRLTRRWGPHSVNQAVIRIGQRVGVIPGTLRGWVTQAQIDPGGRPGLATGDGQRIKQLEAEVREPKRANEPGGRRRRPVHGAAPHASAGSARDPQGQAVHHHPR